MVFLNWAILIPNWAGQLDWAGCFRYNEGKTPKEGEPMRTIIICDDEDYMRDQLRGYLLQAEPILGEKFNVIACASGKEMLAQAADADMILLDIQMEDLSGMDAAHILREKNRDVCIIFITSMVEYALEGYSVHAFGFLKKPVNFGTFLQQLEDALRTVSVRNGIVLTFQNGPQIDRISSEDICYIEVIGHSVVVCGTKQTAKYPASLGPLDEKLTSHGFSRCHKSYLVNFKHVKRILPAAVLMANGHEVPISKHRRKDFLIEFAKYEGSAL